MAKLVIKSHEAHLMSHVPEVPCFYVLVELHGSKIITTNVMVSYDDNFGEASWEYGHSVNPEFDEADCHLGYKPSEAVLKYAKAVIEGSDSFKNWKCPTEVLPSSDGDTYGWGEGTSD